MVMASTEHMINIMLRAERKEQRAERKEHREKRNEQPVTSKQ